MNKFSLHLVLQQLWLLNAESDSDICLETLTDLNKRLSECAAITKEYRLYQKTFKVN